MENRLPPLRRVFRGVSPVWRNALSSLFRRDVAPAVCYNDCNGAYKIALSVGKSDKLCDSNGSFMKVYNACISCIEENSDSTKTSLHDYVEPQFGQFISYCEGEDDTEPTTTFADPEVVVVTTEEDVEPTTTIGGFEPLTTENSQIPSATTDCDGCITTALEDYRGSTIMIVLGTKTVPTSSLLDIKQTVTYRGTGRPSSSATSEADRNEPDSPSSPNLATIIGPVVPSVVLLIVFAFLGFRWYKKRERVKDQEAQIEVDEEPKVEKAQLHSDCVSRPTYELEGSMPFVPDPISSDGAEMAANEVAAHEMSTDKKLGERRVENEEVQVNTEERKGEKSKPDESKSGNGDNDGAGASK
ncbi:hypothetical protein CEP51_008735 [Fusarium floridanum]|uniref:Uncharacterized protein n=1 Tax=Fusarium floridanum TaxID=1325733 RepID=A0A428RJW8_9HYPO|nr:hypothetical protein CEP51_008735 [Fusarium floridanum]